MTDDKTIQPAQADYSRNVLESCANWLETRSQLPRAGEEGGLMRVYAADLRAIGKALPLANAVPIYTARLKSRQQMERDIPRERLGWWHDVCAGQRLVLRDATPADLARCSLRKGDTRGPEEFLCELPVDGSLVSKEAIVGMDTVWVQVSPLAATVPSKRSAADYAIEHAGYLAEAANTLVDRLNAEAAARQAVDDAEDDSQGKAREEQLVAAVESTGEAMRSIRSRVYEFEKRRDRALSEPPALAAGAESDERRWRLRALAAEATLAVLSCSATPGEAEAYAIADEAMVELIASECVPVGEPGFFGLVNDSQEEVARLEDVAPAVRRAIEWSIARGTAHLEQDDSGIKVRLPSYAQLLSEQPTAPTPRAG